MNHKHERDLSDMTQHSDFSEIEQKMEAAAIMVRVQIAENLRLVLQITHCSFRSSEGKEAKYIIDGYRIAKFYELL